jgi:hypothetical protein
MKKHYSLKMKTLFILLFITNSILAQEVELVSNHLNTFQNVRDFCISTENEEAYFTIQSPNQETSQIVCVKNNNWSQPELVSFCDEYSYLEPFLSHDGKKLYFASNRPKNDSIKTKSDYDIWFVERDNTKAKWSNPINLGNKVNSENDEFYPTLSANNNLYFTMDSKAGLGKDDIYYCKFDGKEYAEPVMLSSKINSVGYEFNAFISKDESFLIYTKYNAIGGLGSGDLYLSKKDDKGAWTIGENMGNIINTKYMEYCPFYDSETQTLYFTSKRSTLNSKKFKNLEEYQNYITNRENGLSKIYKYKIQIN